MDNIEDMVVIIGLLLAYLNTFFIIIIVRLMDKLKKR